MGRATNSTSKLVAGMCAVWFLSAAFAVAGDSHSGAYLGVHIADLTPETAASLKAGNGGVLVLSIDQDGPACKAGLKSNDVITAVDGKKVQNSQQLVGMMQTMSGGQTANLAILRDGTSQNIKVKLGSRHEWMSSQHIPVANSMMAGPTPAPMPPMAYPPDPEVPLFTPASARRGVVVEAMTAQLGEFFGVPSGQGVLVRNVQKGSLAASSGLKAGDVIVKVNGETIRDLADWRRSMHSATGKTTFSIIRDKHEQTVFMNLPGPASGLRLGERDWDGFEKDLNALNEQMEQLGPEIQRQTQEALLLKRDELERLQRDIEKQTREAQKQMRKLEPQMKKQAEEIQKQMEQMEQMQPEIQRQITEAQKAMTLSQADMEKMRHDIEDSMKAITPQIQQEIQQQMQELQKQMEQHKFDLDEMMKDCPPPERPNEF